MTKQKITREAFSELSTDLAETEHHKDCKYPCCGSHNDFVDYDKCPVCGMTEAVQNQHNDEVWQIIDSVETNLLDKYEMEE